MIMEAILVDLNFPRIKKLAPPEYEVAAFDYNQLPDPLAAYVKGCADRLQTAPDFIAVSVICALAGAIGTRVRVQPKAIDQGWITAVNVWGALVGAPSSMKSPSLTEGLKPLKAYEKGLRYGFKDNLREYEAKKKLSDIRLKQAESEAAKQSKGGKDEQAFAELSLAMDAVPSEPTEPRIIVNDSTIPALGVLLNENEAGLLLVRDELTGWLAEMQNENKGGDRAFYLEAYNGLSDFTYDRISRGTIHIENCCLSLVGGIQPSRIAPIVADASQGRVDDGLLQRFQLIVWPKTHQQPSYDDLPVDQEALLKVSAVIDALASLSADEPRIIKFTPDAQECFITWWNDLGALIDSEPSELFKAYLIKQKRTVCSLAAIFALVADPSALTIGYAAFARAALWCEYLQSHARKLYQLDKSVAHYSAMLVAERMNDLPVPFTARDLYRKEWRGCSTKESAEAAINLLLDHGYLMRDNSKGEQGRPTDYYQFNPKLEAAHLSFEGVSHDK